ncbi:MAG: DEAD/DEAH box helicase [Gammaproteobacteria bacterium]|nr:DEAD/DEAH box helicase [Gammaproteobacteria bacterium]
MAAIQSFDQLGVNPKVLKVLGELGYERPSPIQEQSIPILLQGRDIMAQAQTGTGKTAAFALPILTRLSLKKTDPQALVLAPTRELAIQVAEAFQSYAKHISGFHVLPIYGGQEYRSQLRALKRGVHVVVGTPGRVIDHLQRGTLRISALSTVVLDEADEMLRMGFIKDVQWILEQVKAKHQTALFSATMPSSILSMGKKFLNNPARVHIEPTVSTVSSIDQHYMLVAKKNKLEALTRYFEVEDVDAALIFTGTKTFSVTVAEKLAARGYAVSALNGDMSQSLREQVITKLKRGKLDIVVATEVAARGLDVERISHVINFDIPQAAESYIHRIGRTGRAGRSGKALLFVTPREQRMLQEIEKAVGKKIKAVKPPSVDQVQSKRSEKFKDDIMQALTAKGIGRYREMIADIVAQGQCSELDIAAAATYLAHKDKAQSMRDYEEVKFEKDSGKRRSSDRKRSGPGRRGAPFKRSRSGDRKGGKKTFGKRSGRKR